MWFKLTEMSVGNYYFMDNPSIVDNGRKKWGIENGVPFDDPFEQVYKL